MIDKIFEIEKFKGYKGQNISLQILEYESMVQEEEPVEEAAGRVHIHDIDAHKRALVKDLSW